MEDMDDRIEEEWDDDDYDDDDDITDHDINAKLLSKKLSTDNDSPPRSMNAQILNTGDIVVFEGNCSKTHYKYTLTTPMKALIRNKTELPIIVVDCNRITAGGYTWHPIDCRIIQSKKLKQIKMKKIDPVIFNPEQLI